MESSLSQKEPELFKSIDEVVKEKKQQEGEKKIRLKTVNRQQMMMRVVDVEKLVAQDHEVRAIWQIVERLDLSRYYEGIEAMEGKPGCSAYSPVVLISLWIYSYSKGISSAREISRLCEYNPAYQWLSGMEVINHHTLSDFRTSHQEGLKGLFVEVLAVLSGEGLITLERVMHDGTKIKASAGNATFRREKRIQDYLQIAREQVKLMEEQQDEEVTERVRRAQERAAKENVQRLELALKELEKIREMKVGQEAKQEARASMTDPQARIMKQGDGGYAPCYNVQISTDATAKIIVGVGVSQSASDYDELLGAHKRVEENLGRGPEQMVVDGGYTSRQNIIGMAERGVDLIGSMGNGIAQSAGQMDRRGVDKEFRPEAFSYDAKTDSYRCPAGNVLKYDGKEERLGRTNFRYRAKGSDCQGCRFKSKCCPQNAPRGRSIVRGVDAPEVVAFIAKMETQEAKAIYKQRGPVAEFPNAWIKDKIKLRQFRLRGMIKVHMEALWACLTYNIKQWIRLCWKPQLALLRA